MNAQMKLPFEDSYEAIAANDNQPPINRLEAKWRVFHAKNPHVYELVKRFALEVIAKGYEHYSINSIFERVRWHSSIETKTEEQFKLSNNHRPYYARLFHKDHPEHDGFFITHAVKGE